MRGVNRDGTTNNNNTSINQDGGASRSQSGPHAAAAATGNPAYMHQLKKQVQASSKANNIDPLATKQYLQNYLSEHPAQSQGTHQNAAQHQQHHQHSMKQPIGLKVSSKQGTTASHHQKLVVSASNSLGAIGGAGLNQGGSSQLGGGGVSRQNYSSLTKSDAAVLGDQQRVAGARQYLINRNANMAFTAASGVGRNSVHSSFQEQTSGSHFQGIGTGLSEASSFDRIKGRASSSSKQKLSSTTTTNIQSSGEHTLQGRSGSNPPSRSLVRPSSKNTRQSSQPKSEKGPGGVQQKRNQSRGSSPKVPAPNAPIASQQTQQQNQSQPQTSVSGQNLQNYFDNQQMGHHYGQGAGSQKNLPRKKRPTQQQPPNNSGIAASGGASKGAAEGAGEPQMRAHSLGKNPSALPPMGAGVGHATGHHSSSDQLQRAPSPGTAAFPNKSNVNHEQPRPGSRNHSNTNTDNKGGRPTTANHEPQPFQKEELFLNIDSQYNDLLMQMIQPNRSHFDFEGSVQYVMNASELSNEALAKMLYSRESVPLPKLPATLQAQLKPPQSQSRSRNFGGGDSSSLARNGAAGQSTASFFNTKRSFPAATLSLAQSGLVENGIKVPDGYHDGPDSSAQIGSDFFENIRGEVRTGTDEHIRQLMADYQAAKYSAKRNGIVAAYGANTNQGIVRNYNEDRVAIILNIMKPKTKQFTGVEWPKCSFFGIYDGHGGNVCADFLRDYLHQFIIKDKYFPKEPIKAIKNGFREAEKLFLEFAEGQQFEVGDIDKSGSCAIVALIIDDMCYIGNTGDSRACMSAEGGRHVIRLSTDHKPTDEIEMHRILTNSGRIYQNASIVNVQQPGAGLQSQVVLGPHRVFPGRLSVCRTFGDIEAKVAKVGGNARVVVADPDVTAFRIDRASHDFIVIGCDGIFDKLESRDCVHLVWQACLLEQTGNQSLVNPVDEEMRGAASTGQKQPKTQDERRHKLAGLAVDSILKSCAMRHSCDNITTVVIAFDNFYRKLDESKLRGPESGVVSRGNEFDVFEETQMPIYYEPAPGGASAAADAAANMIYIESDDHLESITESQGPDGVDEQARLGNDAPARQATLNSDSSLLWGETGTTQAQGPGSMANQQPAAAAGMPQYSNPLQPGQQPQPANGQDKILSEIAEEDSLSMVSDRHTRSRFGRPSDGGTPAEPVSNSFMGSTRASKAGKLSAQGQEKSQTSRQVVYESAAASSKTIAPNAANLAGNAFQAQEPSGKTMTGAKPVPAGSDQGPYQLQTAKHSIQITGNSKNHQNNSRAHTLAESSDQAQIGPMKRSRPSSSSGQQQQKNSGSSSQGRPQKKNLGGGGPLHQLLEQNQQQRSRQLRKGYVAGLDQQAPQLSQTVPSINQATNAYGNSMLYQYTNNSLSAATSAAAQQQTTAGAMASASGGGSLLANKKAESQSQLGLGSASASILPQAAPPSLLHHQQTNSNSQSQQLLHHSSSEHLQPHSGAPLSTAVGANSGKPSLAAVNQASMQPQSSSTGALYQVKVQQKRNSNQSHQRGTYTNQNSASQQNLPSAASQGPMPQPTSASATLLPIQSSSQQNVQQASSTTSNSGAISLANQKLGRGQQAAAQKEPTGKKAKTQQPNKLVELFRQVEPPGSGGATQAVNTSLNASGAQLAALNQSLQGGSQTSFAPAGSQSSKNQIMLRTMPMNNNVATHGAQVHNIQIKPISANKRRSGAGPQNLIQAQLAGAGGSQVQSGTVTLGNIMSRKVKGGEKNQLSQTSVLDKSLTAKQAKQPSNQLISQYLAQVNQSSSSQHQQQPPTQQSSSSVSRSAAAATALTYGGGYASRSTRNNATAGGTAPGSEKSPGVISRAHRVQMTYNQNLPSSKSLIHQGSSSSTQFVGAGSMSQQPGARQQSSGSASGHHHHQDHSTASTSGKNKTNLPAGSAYVQSLLPSSTSQKKKIGGAKSRNGVSHTSGGAQGTTATSGGGSQLQKWQSLNNAIMNSSGSIGIHQQQHHGHFDMQNMAGITSGSGQPMKKRKSNKM